MNEAVHVRSAAGQRRLFPARFAGSRPRARTGSYNAAYHLLVPAASAYDEYRKTRLVVVGEYLPFGDRFPWLRHALGIGGMDFTQPATGPRKVFTLQDPAVSLAPLICFEDTLQGVGRRRGRRSCGPTPSSPSPTTAGTSGMVRGSGASAAAPGQDAVFRCVEHDRPMIRCANNGISCLVDAERHGDQTGSATRTGGEIDVGRRLRPARCGRGPAHGTLYEACGRMDRLALGRWWASCSPFPFSGTGCGGFDPVPNVQP